MSALSELLRSKREHLKLSLSEVAKRASMTKSHLHDLESGRSANPTVQTLSGLARELNIDAHDLIDACFQTTSLPVCATCGGSKWVTGWCENIPTGPEDCPTCIPAPKAAQTAQTSLQKAHTSEHIPDLSNMIGPQTAEAVQETCPYAGVTISRIKHLLGLPDDANLEDIEYEIRELCGLSNEGGIELKGIKLKLCQSGRYQVLEDGKPKVFNLINGAGQTVQVTELWDSELPERYRAFLSNTGAK